MLSKLIKKVNNNDIQDLTIDELVNILNYADKMYYQEGKEPIFDDNVYDFLREKLEKIDPSNKYFSNIGYNTNSHLKVSLPFWMGSMDKLKADDKIISKWSLKYKGPYLISEKLDGISLLIIINNNEEVCIYTRGNGIIGSDVSYIRELFDFELIKNEMRKNKLEKITVRGELIISKENFKKYPEFNKSRNMISGLIHRKDNYTLSQFKDNIDFIAFELLEPRFKILEQFKLLKILGFKIPLSTYINILDSSILSNLLLKFRISSEYEIDGIIIMDDNFYPTNNDKNPKHAFAFKMLNNDEIAETRVINVEWNLSKDGYLIPRIIIEPVILNGSKINKMSGKNAKFIEKNKIGIGTILQVTLDGGVIPGVLKVLYPSMNALMPEGDIVWDDTHTHLKYIHKNIEIELKECIYFFKTIKTENMDVGIITKLYNHGFKTVKDILLIKKEQLLEIEGFKEKLASKIISNIEESIKNISLSQLMNASNVFSRGLGPKKLSMIIDTYPDILKSKLSIEELIKKVIEIDGFSHKLASLFVNDIEAFNLYMKDLNLNLNLNLIKKENDLFKNEKIVMTGFRDDKIMQFIILNGGNITTTISKNTSFLICINKNKNSSKLDNAIKLNIPIIELNNFKIKYNLL